MIMRPLAAAALFYIGLFAACGQSGAAGTITADEFERNMGSGVQLIDVRTADEYGQGHLKDARLLDWSNGDLQRAMAGLDKDTPVLLYCASGRRSAAAREYMQKAGFKQVNDLAGGIQSWMSQGKPVTD